jgi:hypothetical protein
MKYSQWIGVAAVIVLILSSFMHWTWYPDLHKYFTGFYSENNDYGRPGKLFIFFGSLSIILFMVPRVWAKRWNILVCAITLSWAIRCFIVFSGCYRGICPVKQAGIWIMLCGAVMIMIAALFPDTSIKTNSSSSFE